MLGATRPVKFGAAVTGGGGGGTAPSYVSEDTAVYNGGTVTVPSGLSNAKVLLIGMYENSTTATPYMDGPTFDGVAMTFVTSSLIDYTTSRTCHIEVWEVAAPSSGDVSITDATWTGTNPSSAELSCLFIDNAGDVSCLGTDFGGGAATLQVSGSTTVDNSLVLSIAVGGNENQTYTEDDSQTVEFHENRGGNPYWEFMLGWRVISSAGAITDGWSADGQAYRFVMATIVVEPI